MKYYPQQWYKDKAHRRKKYARMLHTKCKLCEQKGNGVDAHHIIPISQGGTDNFRNRVNVCKRCHNILEEYADRGIYFSPSLAERLRQDMANAEEI